MSGLYLRLMKILVAAFTALIVAGVVGCASRSNHTLSDNKAIVSALRRSFGARATWPWQMSYMPLALSATLSREPSGKG